MTPRVAVLSFSAASDAAARRTAEFLGADLWTLAGDRAERLEKPGDLLAQLFAARRPIIGFCAAGILIRLLAPHLTDKHVEPPVIAVSPEGGHVVPLLGGHHGANPLAERLAGFLGGTAAITTASDTVFGVALDVPPAGYVLAGNQDIKPFAARLLAGEKIALTGLAPWLDEAGLVAKDGTVPVRVDAGASGPPGALQFVPEVLVAGVGCERGCDGEQIVKLVEKALREGGFAQKALAAIASIDLKSDEPGLLAAADHFGVPLRLFSASELAGEASRLPNPSPVVLREVGTPGVAEAGAIKAGKLVVEKIKSARATCAIGIAKEPLEICRFGRPVGFVQVVGLGPGEALFCSPQATAALAEATDWVGYAAYLEQAGDVHRDQKKHAFGLGDEEARVRHALELAGQGARVALICSGDPAIFAMASLACELLDAKGSRALSDAARRVALEIVPGISAFQLASARAGALIGHDFCAISLSDLLTPHDQIVARLKAAASGDFVTCLYNPRSARRTDLLDFAHETFLAHRPQDTPVIVARNLGRTGEKAKIVTLGEFEPHRVDMLTIVLIGSSRSRFLARANGKTLAYTPRGYEKKARPLQEAVK